MSTQMFTYVLDSMNKIYSKKGTHGFNDNHNVMIYQIPRSLTSIPQRTYKRQVSALKIVPTTLYSHCCSTTFCLTQGRVDEEKYINISNP